LLPRYLSGNIISVTRDAVKGVFWEFSFADQTICISEISKCYLNADIG
jgi:hypothetical protein